MALSSSGLGLAADQKLQKELGKMGLHSFYSNFYQADIKTWSQLKSMGVDEIRAKCTEAGVPPPAIEHMLKNMGKLSVAPASRQPGTTAVKRKAAAKTGLEARPKHVPKATASRPSRNTVVDKSAVEQSSYYHFASTPAELSANYDAQKVEDPTQAEWETANGASAWNPGNTTENRDFSEFAKEVFDARIKESEFGGMTVSKVKKSTTDFTVVSNRGKIKYIYDVSFEAKLSTGKLEVSDIMPDDDDWYITVSDCSREEKALIQDDVVPIIQPIMDELVHLIQGKLGLL